VLDNTLTKSLCVRRTYIPIPTHQIFKLVGTIVGIVSQSGHDPIEPDSITFTTDRGSDVTVTAEAGQLFVTIDSSAITINQTSAVVETCKGTVVLALGIHRVQGNREAIKVPIEEYKEDIEELRKESKDDSPLTYEVEEFTHTIRSDWGNKDVTKHRLSPSKTYGEMTGREQTLSHRVNTDDVPSEAEPGDVLTLDDLLDDTRTKAEKEQDALDEAVKTGEEVTISKTMTPCNSSSKECNLDHVTRVATPGGDIETRRTHTY
jgi:hypothetical protein